jgi:cell wall-associated NlpC family hydrolase
MAVPLVSLVLVVSVLGQGAAVAAPSPTGPQVRARLVKLNERADKVVEQYNQATETYRKQKKEYDVLNSELGVKNEQAETLRRDLVTVAVNDYRYGSFVGWERFLVEGTPQATLGRMAALDQLAQDKAAKVRTFDAANKELRVRRDGARSALAKAQAARDKVRGQKTEVEKLVAEQTRILRKLGAFQAGDPDSTGIKYTGPASGSARTTLQFAFAQVGKPYQYGATGPRSYDCSGLAQAAWRSAGVQLPRTTWTQWSWGADRRVSLNALQPGDLLFSRGLGHMGIYVGGGKMVHAPQTGDVVKVVDLDAYWRARLLGAVRP